MEGIWETEKGAALRLFAWPKQDEERNAFEISIPKLSSLILTHDVNGEVKGLKILDTKRIVRPCLWSSGHSASWWVLAC